MNNKKRLLISLFIGTAIICSTFAYSTFIVPKNLKTYSNKDLKLAFSRDANFTEKDLVDKSDIIVKGTIEKIKEKTIKVITSDNGDGTISKIECPYIIYDLKVTDGFKGIDNDNKTLEVATVDANFNGFSNILTEGKEYVLYLYKAPKISDKAYAITSYYEGVYENDGNANFKNISNGNIVNDIGIKDRISKLSEEVDSKN